MKIIITVFLLSSLLFINSALAWNSYTHKILWNASLNDTDLNICTKSEIKKIQNTAPTLPDRGGNKETHNCYESNCLAMKKVDELLSKAKIEKDFCNKMFILGQASHYYTDAKNPAHQKLVPKNCHNKFEKAVDKYIKFGFDFPVSIKCRGTQTLTFDKGDFEN